MRWVEWISPAPHGGYLEEHWSEENLCGTWGKMRSVFSRVITSVMLAISKCICYTPARAMGDMTGHYELCMTYPRCDCDKI